MEIYYCNQIKRKTGRVAAWSQVLLLVQHLVHLCRHCVVGQLTPNRMPSASFIRRLVTLHFWLYPSLPMPLVFTLKRCVLAHTCKLACCAKVTRMPP